MGRSLVTTPHGGADDPLTRAIAPPADETPEARHSRLQREARAKQISDEIDSQLQAEQAVLKKRKKCVKVLLLGQSESGKSTTLKNFQLAYARKAWTAEKDAWRAVIQLNLVRSILMIADAVRRELDAASGRGEADVEEEDGDNDLGHDIDGETVVGVGTDADAMSRSVSASPPPAQTQTPLSERHRELIAHLEVLRSVQSDLERRLGAEAAEDSGMTPVQEPAQVSTSTSVISVVTNTHTSRRPRRPQEFFVRSSGWKHAVQRLRPRLSTSSRRDTTSARGGDEGSERCTRAIAGARETIRALWEDRAVRDVVRRRKVRLMDCAEFFLGEVDRVARPDYSPSDDDIIRARLRTIGVQEHRVTLETGPEAGSEWLIYDVGGSRSMRAQWPSYFDDVNSVIFLAPISCFDECLTEDRDVNRLDDTLQLWRLLCANKLLARTELVLFLNKCDLLKRKLREGVRFSEFVTSYGDRDNEPLAVSRYLKAKFSDIFRQHSKAHRGLHIHFTSVVDTKATAVTLAAVQDGILRGHLRHLDLI